MDVYDIAIIGAGPAGYTAAIRAAQQGFKVACIDRRQQAGGTCLNIGCIPSKALLQSSYKYWDALQNFTRHGITFTELKRDIALLQSRKAQVVKELVEGIASLLQKNKITFITGQAHLSGTNQIMIDQANGEKKELTASHIILAPGSKPIIPPGITVDEKLILSSTGALELDAVPSHLIVMGGGYIGLELGTVWLRLGARVTIVEAAPTITPSLDRDLSKALLKSLTAQGMEFLLSTEVIKLEEGSKGNVTVTVRRDGRIETLAGEKILIAVGRKPSTEGLGVETLGIQQDEKGRIRVNTRYETNIPGIYAIGDAIPGPMLAHKGEEEGIAVAEIIAGQNGQVNYAAIPAVVYTHPEVATVGQTEEELQQKGVRYQTGRFPFGINSRAKANGDAEGFVKILAEERSDQILGVHIFGPEAGTLIAQAGIAIEYSASAEDLARICYAHPTLSEALKEAALDVAKRSLNK